VRTPSSGVGIDVHSRSAASQEHTMFNRVSHLIAAIANGTVFGGSRVGRIIGFLVSITVLLALLFFMSR
jgi:hypothetical protein